MNHPNTARAYYLSHREELLAKGKIYRNNNRKLVAERNKKWVNANRDLVRGYGRKCARKYRDARNEYNKIWCSNNPDNVRKHREKYRDRCKLNPCHNYAQAVSQARYYQRNRQKRIVSGRRRRRDIAEARNKSAMALID